MANRSTLSFSHISIGEGRDHISFIDRSIYTAHSITDRADYRTRIPIELINRRLHICRLFDSTSRFPSSPIFFLDGSCSVPRGGKRTFLPYNSFASNDFYLVSFPSILWMKYYNNYLVHLCITRSQVFWRASIVTFSFFILKKNVTK